ncbi:hypothetical protein BC936DRAFT_136840 [Jimgerdemannia flammicorona]|uniref:Uncharacterized protein n=1 Tax=Jimgerdemannia flammicorona TaxID=994334 RepID=A0A433CYP0_9FUNG|nr:hypothetical protein BC936DRAFT_136840 [Jimgerdemannia flammicorona]
MSSQSYLAPATNNASFESDIDMSSQSVPVTTSAANTTPNASVVPINLAAPTDSKTASKEFIRNMLRMGLTMTLDIVLPVALYYIIKPYLAPIWALLISGTPPLIMIIYGLIFHRRIDFISVIVLVAFVLSAILAIVDGEPRLLLLRESAITCVIGLIFLFSLVPFRIGSYINRPLVYRISAQTFPMPPVKFSDGTEMPRSEWLWQNLPRYRHDMRLVSAAWGIGMLAEFTAKVIMVESSLTIDGIVLIGNIVLGSVTGGLTLFNVFYGRGVRARAMADAEEFVKINAAGQA